MTATGLQQRIDSGSFLERYALLDELLWKPSGSAKEQTSSFTDPINARFAALRKAYEKRRPEYQKEYENHINWEFTEAELAEIVEFLEGSAGQHYLNGSWRMEAYVGTNVEELEERIVNEAVAALATK